ncbi:MAG: thioether cross-link-forming SCIFF peptide maturase [Christensenellaceae bacterium]|nr:thioether cross-link-forming SCIFF peptide maturase [Christensenellaceae bacterium]
MVHAFSFNDCGNFRYYIFDVESGSLMEADYSAFLCAKNRYSVEFTSNEKNAFAVLSAAELREANEELDSLEADGLLNTPPVITSYKKPIGALKALCLHTCHDCNMSCDYCFASDGTYGSVEREVMSVSVMKRSIDFLIENSKFIKNLEIDFFGGEPLLHLDNVKEAVAYARAREKETGKKFSFTLTTNCLALNGETAKYLADEMQNVVLSIDGRRCVHERVRHSKSGDSYTAILKNAQQFRALRGDKNYYVRGTFTNKNLDFSEDVKFLSENGFDQISVEPVVLPKNHPLAITETHIEAINKEYERLATLVLTERRNGHFFNFFHFMADLTGGPCVHKRLNGCGAGCDYLAVAPNGTLAPCHRFTGNPDFVLGNVFDGISDTKSVREKFTDTLLSKPHCADCFAKYNCGGGCAANSFEFSGSTSGQYKTGCEFQKKRTELALGINACLTGN